MPETLALILALGALAAALAAAVARSRRFPEAARADLLVMSWDGDRSRPGLKSVGPAAGFVLDHVTVPGPPRLSEAGRRVAQVAVTVCCATPGQERRLAPPPGTQYSDCVRTIW